MASPRTARDDAPAEALEADTAEEMDTGTPAVGDGTSHADLLEHDATRSRSYADRLARQILRVDEQEQEALMPLRGSLVLSAVRCILSYVVVPIAAPLVSWLGPLATPLSLLLSVAAIGLAVRSLRRVWLADWSRRWAYTAFAGVVIVVLAALIVYDITQLV